jgi:hypothetical protein
MAGVRDTLRPSMDLPRLAVRAAIMLVGLQVVGCGSPASPAFKLISSQVVCSPAGEGFVCLFTAVLRNGGGDGSAVVTLRPVQDQGPPIPAGVSCTSAVPRTAAGDAANVSCRPSDLLVINSIFRHRVEAWRLQATFS